MRYALRQFVMIAFAAALLGCAGAGQTTGEFVDDSTITSKVKTKLFADSDTSGWKISVSTEQGVVHLTGAVGSAKEKARAGEIARSVAGVKSVRNDLVVK